MRYRSFFRNLRGSGARWSWLLAGLLSGASGPVLGQVRVLFVGNSYTHGAYKPVLNYNAAAIIDENAGLRPSDPRYENPAVNGPGPWGGIPGIFKKFADQAGLAYEVHLEAISGVALQYHYTNALAVIAQSRWNQVVLQEQSTLPLPVARGGQPAMFAEYATRLEQAVHAASPTARLYLYQTWARADLLYLANASYAGATAETMTQDLHAAYYQLAATNGRVAAVAPVGNAWLRAIQAGVALRDPFGRPTGLLDLWAIDNQHPSPWGAYLSACVLFGQLTGRDPRTLGATELAAADLGIAPAQAVALQGVAFQQLAAASAPLPVVLTSFGAQRQAAGVALRWATASEQGNGYFEVQRSLDGVAFAPVAVVPGHGTTTQPSSYAVLDPAVPFGPLYYRLSQVDFDGQSAFSPVVALAGAPTAPAFFPNPAREVVELAAPTATSYRIRNVLGQQVAQGPLPAGRATVGLAHVPAGIYLIQFQVADTWLTHRLEKQ